MFNQSQINKMLHNTCDLWVSHGIANKSLGGKACERAWVFGKDSKTELKRATKDLGIYDWQLDEALEKDSAIVSLATENGPLWIIRLTKAQDSSTENELKTSDYSVARDVGADLTRKLKSSKMKDVEVKFFSCSKEQIVGSLVGVDLAAYEFLKLTKGAVKPSFKLYLNKNKGSLDKATLDKAKALASSVNISRHLINLPAEDLNPKTYSQLVKALFKDMAGVKVNIWNAEKLQKENMGMFYAVGKAAAIPPCMVHIEYRPRGSAGQKPLAFVGKGVTFDSGGLDIKPAGAMRWMKKDMGGSSVVVALANWVTKSKFKKPCDFYIGLAENAIAGNAFRPGDILQSRKGLTVEIHNTDAEGRLVLGDVLDVASTQKQKPAAIIDIATLTGAMKIGLGAQLGGVFSNSKKLSEKLVQCGQKSGDYFWPMPLDQRQRRGLKSTFADMVNCGEGWGGAVTAALFLESFVDCKNWAHLDIMAWGEANRGAQSESGASGQAVQCLAHYLM